MSYFDDASLVMIPSGYKTSKVYSVKPTDGSGDLTFSRSNDTATRVNSAGLIEKVRTNLALRSQSFATSAVWATVNGTVTNNAGTAPDGTNTASKIVATDSDPFVYQSLTLSGSVAVSCYVKGIGSSIGKTGSVRAASSLTTFTITGDWQRVSLIHTASGAQNYGVETPESAAVSDEVLLWGFQVEYGDVATDYIATTTAAVSVGPVANVPRLDYLNSSCPRLLLEPQRTNLLTYSEQFNNAAYILNNATITANSVVSPDGYTNADTYTAAGSNNYLNAFGSSSGSNTITYSVFVKAGTQSVFRIREAFYFGTSTIFNLSTGTVTSGTGTITSYGNGWYRCTMSQAYGAGQGNLNIIFDTTASSGTFYLYGAQAEVGAYATSYIPTLGAAVTRGADACTKTGISSLIGSTEGVLYAEVDVKLLQQAGRILLDVNDNNTTNRVLLALNGSAVEGFVQGSPRVAYTLPSAGVYKFAFAYKSGDFALYVNGVQRSTSTDAITFSGMNQLFLGHTFNINNTQPVDGIKSALLFPTRLSNSDLAALTA